MALAPTPKPSIKRRCRWCGRPLSERKPPADAERPHCPPTVKKPESVLQLGRGMLEATGRQSVSVTECGTYAAYQRHGRNGEVPDPACKAAAAEYTRNWRAGNPELRQRERVATAARGRALWRLADAHPEEFQRLALDEMRTVGAWRSEVSA